MGAKKELRNKILSLRDALDLNYRKAQSEVICNSIRRLLVDLDQSDLIIHTYLPMGSEVNVYPLITELLKSNFTLLAPKTLKNRMLENRKLTSLNLLEKGVFGTIHPASPAVYEGSIDVFLVPGVAFDKQGNRLGYGAGYYDTLLEKHPKAHKIAICYPEQVVDQIPTEAHDVKMTRVIYQ
ncbi:MAG: 5-formyltetrahydrofolate cyclo-ligase [Flavobacteriales bacterium]|nr:5-formyltetrahydrofolate cyclo-ligase [Flavobacteriales bacterium]